MALYVYITDECKKTAEQHSYLEKVEGFKQRIINEQRTTLFDNFPPPYLKKRFERQIRLIAAERFIGEDIIVVFYRVFVRGEKDYSSFLANPRAYGEENLITLVSDSELEKWLEEEKKAEIIMKPKPSELEQSYLWDVTAYAHDENRDLFIFESHAWVRQVKEKQFEKRLLFFLHYIREVIFSEDNDGYKEDCIDNTDMFLVYRYLEASKKLFIAGVYRKGSTKDRDEILRVYDKILNASEEQISEEMILKLSARAYVYELLFDDDRWIDAEKDEVANLALSPEEAYILETVHTQTGFPLFINGRAGSGKSTILQYLFSDYVRHYLSLEDKSIKPIYFACSGELIEKAKINVSSMIKCSNTYTRNSTLEVDSCNTIYEQLFNEFHNFLYNMLNDLEKVHTFQKELYVNYSTFKSLWQEKFSHDKNSKLYTADISWHVIRTFIKGYSMDFFLDSEEYEELPKDEKNVTKETYELVFNRVWEAWYKKKNEDEGLWDDQDLVRYLVKEDKIKPIYGVIFADEVQDFTRVELECLLKMSVFSARSLSPLILSRIPFAFVGDPFQTLNPTGFRWSAIKSAFVVKFIHALDPARQSQVKDLNYHELTFNYRSSKNIVKFSNLIQLLRTVTFGIHEIRPQTVWTNDETVTMPVWFSTSDKNIVEVLRNNSDVTIILPCDEGEEIEYVEKDDFLKSAVKRDETRVPQNVLSAVRAKGLEFNRVVVYGFATHYKFSDFKVAMDESNESVAHDKTLAMQYFINKLYVAVSRPKKRLFIIDTDNGIRDFWSFATNINVAEDLLQRLKKDTELWQSNICILQPGVKENWNADQENIEVIAERYEKEGFSKSDSYLLRSAAISYETIGDMYKAKYCRAAAYKNEQNYLKAGREYEGISLYAEALNCFWRGRLYKEIVELSKVYSNCKERFETRFAYAIMSAPDICTASNLLSNFIESMEKEEFRAKVVSDNSWHLTIQEFVNTIVSIIPSEDDLDNWKVFKGSIDVIKDYGIKIDNTQIALLLYQIGEYESAVNTWELSNKLNNALYVKAKTKVLVNKFESKQISNLNKQDAEILHNYYITQKDYISALEVLCYADSPDRIKELLKRFASDNNTGSIVEAIHRYLIYICEKGLWSEVIYFIQHKSVQEVKAAKAVIDKDLWSYYRTLFEKLSESDLLVNSSNKIKNQILNLVKPLFLSTNYDWIDVLSPLTVGALLERLGRDIDCLQFYENIINDKRYNVVQHKAQERWIKCKYRQAEREKKAGEPKVAEIARKHFEEAASKSAILNINVEELSEYPIVSNEPISISSEQENKTYNQDALKSQKDYHMYASSINEVNFNINDFSFEFLRDKGRISIKDENKDEIMLRINEKRCKSVDVDIIEKNTDYYECEQWNLTIRFDDHSVSVRLPDINLTLSFDLTR